MPAWLFQALRLLGGGALLGAGAELAGVLNPFDSDVVPPSRATLGQGGAPVISQSGQFLGFRGGVKRRRRRRALTASDRADIAFIAGLLGPKAGKDFAVIIGAKG